MSAINKIILKYKTDKWIKQMNPITVIYYCSPSWFSRKIERNLILDKINKLNENWDSL